MWEDIAKIMPPHDMYMGSSGGFHVESSCSMFSLKNTFRNHGMSWRYLSDLSSQNTWLIPSRDPVQQFLRNVVAMVEKEINLSEYKCRIKCHFWAYTCDNKSRSRKVQGFPCEELGESDEFGEFKETIKAIYIFPLSMLAHANDGFMN